MIRPGTKVNSPREQRAAKIEIIDPVAATGARAALREHQHDRREDRQQMDRAPGADQSDLVDPERAIATSHQHHPDPAEVRCGSVPFGAANCTMPSANAAIAAKAWSGMAGRHPAAARGSWRLQTVNEAIDPRRQRCRSLDRKGNPKVKSLTWAGTLRPPPRPVAASVGPARRQNGMSSSMSLLRAPARRQPRGAARS